MLETIAKYVLLIVGAYLLGGIMFAKLLAKHRNNDITTEGSGNPGTMNMLRNHGVIFGVLTLMLDALKGIIPSLVGYFLFGGSDGGLMAQSAIYIGGFFAVLGHIFPIYYNFKGGKGVATSIGFAFIAQPYLALGVMILYLILFFTTRIGSLSSLISVAVFIVTDSVILILHKNYLGFVLLLAIGIMIFVAHRANLKRLANKKETVVDLKAVAQKDVELINTIKEKHNSKSKVSDVEIETKIDVETPNQSKNDVEIKNEKTTSKPKTVKKNKTNKVNANN